MPCKTVTVSGPEESSDGTNGGGTNGGNGTNGGDGTNGGSGGIGLPDSLQKIVGMAKERPMVTVGGLTAAGILIARPGGDGDSGRSKMYMPRPDGYEREQDGGR